MLCWHFGCAVYLLMKFKKDNHVKSNKIVLDIVLFKFYVLIKVCIYNDKLMLLLINSRQYLLSFKYLYVSSSLKLVSKFLCNSLMNFSSQWCGSSYLYYLYRPDSKKICSLILTKGNIKHISLSLMDLTMLIFPTPILL